MAHTHRDSRLTGPTLDAAADQARRSVHATRIIRNGEAMKRAAQLGRIVTVDDLA